MGRRWFLIRVDDESRGGGDERSFFPSRIPVAARLCNMEKKSKSAPTYLMCSTTTATATTTNTDASSIISFSSHLISSITLH